MAAAPSPTPREQHWLGRLLPDSEAAHEAFVAGLTAPEVERALRANGLLRYQLAQSGDRLHVTFAARTPPDGVRFLRFHRLWPDIWEWSGSDPAEFPADATIRFAWTRPDDA